MSSSESTTFFSVDGADFFSDVGAGFFSAVFNLAFS